MQAAAMASRRLLAGVAEFAGAGSPARLSSPALAPGAAEPGSCRDGDGGGDRASSPAGQ